VDLGIHAPLNQRTAPVASVPAQARQLRAASWRFEPMGDLPAVPQ
jgi:hypothetical protein